MCLRLNTCLRQCSLFLGQKLVVCVQNKHCTQIFQIPFPSKSWLQANHWSVCYCVCKLNFTFLITLLPLWSVKVKQKQVKTPEQSEESSVREDNHDIFNPPHPSAEKSIIAPPLLRRNLFFFFVSDSKALFNHHHYHPLLHLFSLLLLFSKLGSLYGSAANSDSPSDALTSVQWVWWAMPIS